MSLTDDLLGCSRDAVAELRRKAQLSRDEAVEIGLKVLVGSDAISHWRFAMELLHLLQELMGRGTLQAWIAAKWPSLPHTARGNITFAIPDPDLFDNAFVGLLFDHPASSVGDRHLIAGALHMSAGPRQATELLLEMLERIGAYPDKYHQDILDDFLAGARADIAARQSKS